MGYNGRLVIAALVDFGTALPDVTPERFTDSRTLLMLGREPFRVDLLTDIPRASVACRIWST